MSYETISYIIYGVLSGLAVLASVVVKILEAKFGKQKVDVAIEEGKKAVEKAVADGKKLTDDTLKEADEYKKAILDGITKAENLKQSTGDEKKLFATLLVDSKVNKFKAFKVTDGQISNDIDMEVAVTKKVNFPAKTSDKAEVKK